jgi:hypothetical protein
MEVKIADLTEEVALAREEATVRGMMQTKLGHVMKMSWIMLFAMLAIQTVMTVLDRDSPFTISFDILLLCLGALYTAGFLSHMAMLSNKKLKLETDLSAAKAKLKLALEESKQASTPPSKSIQSRRSTLPEPRRLEESE